MTRYVVAILLLIDSLEDQNIKHKWYADDVYTDVTLMSLKIVLEKLNVHGKVFEYNITLCQLIGKPK